jgi:hypothetical protein
MRQIARDADGRRLALWHLDRFDSLRNCLVAAGPDSWVSFPEYEIEWLASLPAEIRRDFSHELGRLLPHPDRDAPQREARLLKYFFSPGAADEAEALALKLIEEGQELRAARILRLLFLAEPTPRAAATLRFLARHSIGGTLSRQASAFADASVVIDDRICRLPSDLPSEPLDRYWDELKPEPPGTRLARSLRSWLDEAAWVCTPEVEEAGRWVACSWIGAETSGTHAVVGFESTDGPLLWKTPLAQGSARPMRVWIHRGVALAIVLPDLLAVLDPQTGRLLQIHRSSDMPPSSESLDLAAVRGTTLLLPAVGGKQLLSFDLIARSRSILPIGEPPPVLRKRWESACAWPDLKRDTLAARSLLSHSDRAVRLQALDALFFGPQGWERWPECAQSPDDKIRIYSTLLLALSHIHAAQEHLPNLMHSADPEVAELSALAVIRLGSAYPDSVHDHALNLLRSRNPEWIPHFKLLLGTGRFGDEPKFPDDQWLYLRTRLFNLPPPRGDLRAPGPLNWWFLHSRAWTRTPELARLWSLRSPLLLRGKLADKLLSRLRDLDLVPILSTDVGRLTPLHAEIDSTPLRVRVMTRAGPKARLLDRILYDKSQEWLRLLGRSQNPVEARIRQKLFPTFDYWSGLWHGRVEEICSLADLLELAAEETDWRCCFIPDPADRSVRLLDYAQAVEILGSLEPSSPSDQRPSSSPRPPEPE